MELKTIKPKIENNSIKIDKNNKDFWIIDGILKNSNEVLAQVYQTQFMKIQKLVWSYKNTSIDVDDIFQEGLTRAVVNIRDGRFKGDSSFSTYLYAICRNICRSQLQTASFKELKENLVTEEFENKFELLSYILKVKSTLGENCKEIIDLRFALVGINNDEPNKCNSFDTIAAKLEITSVNARQRFKRCLDQLRKKMKDMPDYQDYF